MNWNRRIILVVALAICASQAAAVPVHVTLVWPGSTPASVRTNIRIQAIQTASANVGAGPVHAEAGPDGAVLNLGDGIWQVQASAPGYWSQGAEVVVAHQAPVNAQLVFWPAATLHGVIATMAGETLPDALEIQLNATPPSANEIKAAQSASSPSHAELHCRVNAGTWNCLAPAGMFDVRMESAGFAPHYEWGVNLKTAQSTDMGRTELRHAASIFGRVVRKDGSNPLGPCQATLQADMERRGPTDPDQEPESGPEGGMSVSVPLTQRGYFQVVGVVPGRYALSVECKAASGFQQLRVHADSETRIDPPLSLEELTLDISVAPKTTPDGQPWRLAVYATAPHYLLIADGAMTSADGHWLRHGLMAGNYRVTVKGPDGTTWMEKYFDLSKNSGVLSLSMGTVKVAGRVQLAMQPVRARLVFSNNAGGETATLTSDDEGHFQGVLPVAAGVKESDWTVEAHIVQPPVSQQLLGVRVLPAAGGAPTWLNLDLPAIPVRGSVVSADGKPQPNIQVIFENANGTRTTTGTDETGKFEMLDLPPGKYTAMADSQDGNSDRKAFEVTESGGSELKLVLNSFNRYSFFVASSDGPVADAAVQVWIAPGVPRTFVRTDENGRFEVSLPPGTKEVGLTIGASGYALKLTRMPVPSQSDDSSDAHTITLDKSSGTLVLNFQPPGRTLDSSATLYLVHKGGIQDALTIPGWGTPQAGASTNGPATVDAVEPGDYALCLISDPSQLATIWSGAMPSDRCSKGSLDESETLTLSPR